MQQRHVRTLILSGLLLCFANESFAFLPPSRPRLPDLDKREKQGSPPEKLPAEKAAALAELHTRVPGASVSFDAVSGAPKIVLARDGFLTGPGGKGSAISGVSLAGIAASDPYRVTKAFLKEHSKLFGHGPEALDGACVSREFTTAHNGLKTVVWEQQVDGVRVFEAVLISHTTRQGELVNIGSQFVAEANQAAEGGTPNRAAVLAAPNVSVREAIARAAQNVGEDLKAGQVTASGEPAAGAEQRQKFKAPGLKGEAEAKLIWLPMNKNTLRLCWDVILMSRARGEMFRVLVDARTGEPLLRHGLTDYLSDATYRVYTSDSPSPFSPGYPTPVNSQPPLVERALVTLSALDTNASPAGWIDDGVNETVGNNVDAHTDRDANDLPDLPRPQGSPFRVFDFAMDLATQDPTNYSQAATVQLFYLCNWMHDKLYELGFTEAAGNFQTDNFGRGGLGSDAVQADAQDGGGSNNADFSTPPDGSPGRMQMYLFTGMSPRRDGDLDAEVVLHEYTHGLSSRRVGGGAGLSALQSEGMGEGWSDFYALSLLSEAGDDVNGNYAAGGYASYQIGGTSDQQNYYFGIRRYPYTTDTSKNPLTFRDIDPAQAHYCSSAAPYHTGMFGTCSATLANEVHNQGEVWCVTLWEARANLINKYGWAVGNQLMLQLVTDGMNLSPPNPNFLQARDAILQADLVDNAGANLTELWAAFAKRGMGFNAASPASSTTTGVQESFDLPDDLRITPHTGFVSSGPVGGPFNVTSQIYSLTNAGSNTLSWTLVNTSLWLSVSPGGGSLLPGAGATPVTVSLEATASNLPAAIYPATVLFSNLDSGVAQNLSFTLRVGQPDNFTELFDTTANDMAFQSFTFTPDGSTSFYSVCREVASSFPTDPTGGTGVTLTDDSYAQVTLSGTNTVSLYGRRTNIFFIGSNGFITWNAGDITWTESLSSHFNRPRISALFHDLNPGTGGTVSWRQLPDRVAVTYQGVCQYGTTLPNNFQIEMFADGRIRLTYLGLNCLYNLAGLSAGLGVPAAFQESDFSTYGVCPPTPPAIITQPANQTARPGTNVTFNVTASGTPPLTYQWRKGGVNLSNGGRISGATSSSLSIASVVDSDSAQYSVLVSNSLDSVLSSNATLLVSTLDHFAWSHLPSPQSARVPFMVTLQAQDVANGTVSNYTGAVAVSGSAGGSGVVPISPSVSANFVQGVWTSSLVVTQTVSDLVLRADDDLGHFGLANTIQVIGAPKLDREVYGNIVLMLWPAGAPALKLETATNLSPAAWVPVVGPPLQIGDQYLVPISMSEPRRFYRLHYVP